MLGGPDGRRNAQSPERRGEESNVQYAWLCWTGFQWIPKRTV
jgi:hypothetical protein